MAITSVSLTADEPAYLAELVNDGGTLLLQLSTTWQGENAVWTNPIVQYDGYVSANFSIEVSGAVAGDKMILRASGDSGATWVYSESAIMFGVYGLTVMAELPAGFTVRCYSAGTADVTIWAAEDLFFETIADTDTSTPSDGYVEWTAAGLKENFGYFLRANTSYGGFTDTVNATTLPTIYGVAVSAITHTGFTLKWFSADDTYDSRLEKSLDGGVNWTSVTSDSSPANTEITYAFTNQPESSQVMYRLSDDDPNSPDQIWTEGTVELRGIRSLAVVNDGDGKVRITVNAYPLTGENLTIGVQWDTVEAFNDDPQVISNLTYDHGGEFVYEDIDAPAGELRWYRATINGYTNYRKTSFRQEGIYDVTVTPDYTSVEVVFSVSPVGRVAKLERSLDAGVTWTTKYNAAPPAGYYEYTDTPLPQGTEVRYRLSAVGVSGYVSETTNTLGLSWEPEARWEAKDARLTVVTTAIPNLIPATPILEVVQGTNAIFKVALSYLSNLSDGDTFRVTGSTGNDGTYTATDVSEGVGNCVIQITGNVPSAVADGDLQNYEDTTALVIDVADNAEFTDAVSLYDDKPPAEELEIHWDDCEPGELYYVRAKMEGGPFDERSQRVPGVYDASAEGINGTTVRVTFDLQPAVTDGAVLSCRVIRSLSQNMADPTVVFSDDLEEDQTHVVIDDDDNGAGLDPNTGYYYEIWPHKTDTDYPSVQVSANTLLQVPPLAGVQATQGTSATTITVTYTDPENIDSVDLYEGATTDFDDAELVIEDEDPGVSLVVDGQYPGRRRYFFLVAKAAGKFDSPPTTAVMGWAEIGTQWVLKTAVAAAADVREGVRRWEPDGEVGTLIPGTVAPGEDNTITVQAGVWYQGSGGVGLRTVTTRDFVSSIYTNGAAYVIACFKYTDDAYVQASDIQSIHYTLQKLVNREWVNVAGHVTVPLTVASVLTVAYTEDIANDDPINFKHILGATATPFTTVGASYRLTYRIEPKTSPLIYMRFRITTV